MAMDLSTSALIFGMRSPSTRRRDSLAVDPAGDDELGPTSPQRALRFHFRSQQSLSHKPIEAWRQTIARVRTNYPTPSKAPTARASPTSSGVSSALLSSASRRTIVWARSQYSPPAIPHPT